MGKGDQKSKRGKIWIGTFGKSRPRKSKKKAAPVIKPIRKR
jgi:30S ribosomal protein S31